jgi:hypothetical protein
MDKLMQYDYKTLKKMCRKRNLLQAPDKNKAGEDGEEEEGGILRQKISEAIRNAK